MTHDRALPAAKIAPEGRALTRMVYGAQLRKYLGDNKLAIVGFRPSWILATASRTTTSQIRSQLDAFADGSLRIIRKDEMGAEDEDIFDVLEDRRNENQAGFIAWAKTKEGGFTESSAGNGTAPVQSSPYTAGSNRRPDLSDNQTDFSISSSIFG